MDQRFEHGLRSWGRMGCLVISLFGLWLVLRHLELAVLAETLLHVKVWWFAAAFLLFGFASLLVAVRWHIVLRSNRSTVHAGATFRMVIIGHFLNTLLLGPTGGDVAKSIIYSRWYGYSAPGILTTCFLDRLLGGAGFLAFAALTPGLAALSNRSSVLVDMVPTASRFWVLLGLALVLSSISYVIHRKFNGSALLRKLTQTFFTGASQLLAAPWQSLCGLLASFLSHICMSALLLLCLQAVTEKRFSLPELVWTFPAISLISSAPITFAGTGLREGSALVLLGLYGIPPADAVAASLLVLVVYLVWAGLAGLLFWREKKLFQMVCTTPPPRRLSVIIPTLNEAEVLAETVLRAERIPEVSEIIVVDGGSTDQTTHIALQLGCRVVRSPRGRGRQMREGACQATGDVVLLLHADTWLPAEAGQAILDCLKDQTVVGGGFWKVFRNPSPLMAGSRFRCAVRLYLGGRVLGDQALFIRRDVLKAIGGVPDMPLMEEFELCRRLRAVGRLALAGATVTTSARRFAKLGVVRTYMRMGRVTLQYYFGTSAQKLQKLYERD